LRKKIGANYGKSLRHFDTNVEQWISPDVFIKLNAKGKWVVHSNQAIKPRLTLNQEYSRILKENNAKKNNLALHQKMLEARWLIKNIEQREETILKVAEAIVERQQNFFHQGNIAMKPLVLREIAAAQITNLLASQGFVVARRTVAKYRELLRIPPAHLRKN